VLLKKCVFSLIRILSRWENYWELFSQGANLKLQGYQTYCQAYCWSSRREAGQLKEFLAKKRHTSLGGRGMWGMRNCRLDVKLDTWIGLLLLLRDLSQVDFRPNIVGDLFLAYEKHSLRMGRNLEVCMQLVSYFIKKLYLLLSVIELEWMAKRMYLHLLLCIFVWWIKRLFRFKVVCLWNCMNGCLLWMHLWLDIYV